MKRLLLIILLSLTALPALCCTTAIVSAGASKSGRPMLWKQRDGAVNTCLAYVSGGKYGYTGLFLTEDTGHKKAYAGINEAGFGIINNLSYNVRPDSVKTDPQNGAFMALVLASCATLEDFEAMLAAKRKPWNLSANFGVVDAGGGAAYFEVSDDTVVRYDVPEGGFLYRTNYSLSGDSERLAGRTRFVNIEHLMQRHAPRKFDPEFFFACSRDFVNVNLGGDLLRSRRSGYIYDADFIPRASTSSAVVIEGVLPGERADSGLMWCAIGYPPCSYAVPVWVAAGDRIPAMMTGEAPANLLAESLRSSLRTLSWDKHYLEVKPLRRTIELVKRFERDEFRAGRKLDKVFRERGLDAAALEQYNKGADARFELFKSQFDL